MSCTIELRLIVLLFRRCDYDYDFVFMYLQDLTQKIDYYILGYNPTCNAFLALVDPLYDSTYCLIEEAALQYFEEHPTFYKVYKHSQRVHYSISQKRIERLFKSM